MAYSRQSREDLTASEVRSNLASVSANALAEIAKTLVLLRLSQMNYEAHRIPLWCREGEELPHGRCGGGRSGQFFYAEAFQGQPEQAWMLIQRCGLEGLFRRRWGNHYAHDSPASVSVIASRFVKSNDEQAVLLEGRILDQRIDVAL